MSDESTTLVPEYEQEKPKSKFLKYQDKNGDGLPDKCDVDISPAEQVCIDCKPNPLAVVRDWRKRRRNSVILNENI